MHNCENSNESCNIQYKIYNYLLNTTYLASNQFIIMILNTLKKSQNILKQINKIHMTFSSIFIGYK